MPMVAGIATRPFSVAACIVASQWVSGALRGTKGAGLPWEAQKWFGRPVVQNATRSFQTGRALVSGDIVGGTGRTSAIIAHLY